MLLGMMRARPSQHSRCQQSRRQKPAAIFLLALVAACALVAQTPAPPQSPATLPSLPRPNVVVLDAAHGGADAGARGASGVLERDVVLELARNIRRELERRGYRVVLTREAAENPSFDERSATANAQRDAVFITLHVASTGTAGTARAYHYGALSATPALNELLARPRLLPWDEAQRAFAEQSRRFAELIQLQLFRRFPASPEAPAAGAVRQLRTVAAPAIALEVSSVAVPDRRTLEQMGPRLAEAIAAGIEAFRPLYAGGRL